ncbi:MAG TPA: XdhC family protein, partial [Ktedonobacterales bacterium]|nr:XdhC family protein [Ktedonobacterales bacterium]
MRETLDDIVRWLGEGKRVAQATVVSLIGSAPRGAGATLVASDAGDIAGSVSNGCVEPDVVEQAQRVMRSGKPRLLTYGVSEEQNYERIGLSCGGEIRVFIERIERTPEIGALEAAHHAGRPAVRAQVIATPGEGGPALGETLTVIEGSEASGQLLGSPLGEAISSRARELIGAASPVVERIPLTGAPEPGGEVEV